MNHQKRIAAMIAEIEVMDGLTGAQEDAAIEAIDALVAFKMALEHEAQEEKPINALDGTYGEFRG